VDLLLFVLLIVLFAEILRQAGGFRGVAALAPTFLGSLGLLVAILGLVRSGIEIVRQRRVAAEADVRTGSGPRAGRSVPTDMSKGPLAALLWAAVFAVTIALLGFVVGGTLFCFVYLRRSARVSWLQIAAIVVPTLLFLAWLVPRYLIVPIYGGWLGNLLS
jgi:hypothetical protein